jgi:hypothetical protein
MLVFFVHHESPRAFHFATNKILLYFTILSSPLLFVEVPSSPCVQNSKGAMNRVSHRWPQHRQQEADASEHCKRSAHCKVATKTGGKKQRKETAKAIWHQGQWYTQKD